MYVGCHGACFLHHGAPLLPAFMDSGICLCSPRHTAVMAQGIIVTCTYDHAMVSWSNGSL